MPKQCLVIYRVDVSERLAPLRGSPGYPTFLSVRRSVVLSSTATDQFVYPPHHQIPRCGIVAHLSPQPRRQEVVPWHHLPRRHLCRKNKRCSMLGLFPSKVQTICTYMHVIRNRPILAAATAFAALARHARMVCGPRSGISQMKVHPDAGEKKNGQARSQHLVPLIPSLRWVSDDYSIRKKDGSCAIFCTIPGRHHICMCPFPAAGQDVCPFIPLSHTHGNCSMVCMGKCNVNVAQNRGPSLVFIRT
ncbi:hypothetical protein HDV63DRAFT_253371 [Trichoderma sp. SZMC 28014]